ncbi:MAG: hypothetical protein ACOC5R_03175 [Elusimicrobiota bacterium]
MIKIEKNQNSEEENILGIRGVLGIEYFFEDNPVEVFIEIAPILEILPKSGISLSGGLGFHFYI